MTTLEYPRQRRLTPCDPRQTYRLEAGLILVRTPLPSGLSTITRQLHPGDYFDAELFEGDPTPEVIAHTPVRLGLLEPEEVDAGERLASLERQARRLAGELYERRAYPLEQRVLRFLVGLTATAAATVGPDGRIKVFATHEQIAEATGGTRETVSKLITELRRQGLVESGYRCVILERPVEELAELAA